MPDKSLFDAQGRTIRRVRTHEEIMADIPAEVKEARRIIAEGGDPGPMPIDRLLYFGSPRHLEILKKLPGYDGLAPPDYDVDRPGDLGLNGVLGPTPAQASKIMTKYGEVFVQPQDLALTPQSEWKNRPGIQVITGDHGPDCCCVCCCCKEPEPPPMFFHPADDCPCPPDDSPGSVGVFIEGVFPNLWEPPKKEQAMQYMCSRYPGKSYYFQSTAFPPDTATEARYITRMLKHLACRYTTISRFSGDLIECPVHFDLFGFSRGGAIAMHVAQQLNNPFCCKHCGLKSDLPYKLVRFLGVIDPTKTGMWSIPGEGWGDTDVPENVQSYFAGFTTKYGWATKYGTDKTWFGSDFPRGEYDLEHGEAGDARDPKTKELRAPLIDMMSAFNKAAGEGKGFAPDPKPENTCDPIAYGSEEEPDCFE